MASCAEVGAGGRPWTLSKGSSRLQQETAWPTDSVSRARFWMKTRCTPVVPGTQQRHLQAPARPRCGVPSARRGAHRAQRGPLSASHPRHQGQPRPTSHPRDGLCKGREVSSCHVGTSGSAAGTTGLPTQVPPTRGPKDGARPKGFGGEDGGGEGGFHPDGGRPHVHCPPDPDADTGR